MKIITQNLEFLFDAGTQIHSGKEWNYTPEFVQARVDHFAEFFKTEDADAILLQELASEEVLKRIIEKSGIDYSYFIATPDVNGVGNAILIKAKDGEFASIPSLSSIPVFVTGDVDTIGPRLWSRRDFTYVKTSYGNKPLHLISIHLKSNFAMPEKTQGDTALPITTQISFTDGMIRSELFRASQAKRARQLLDEIFSQEPDAQIIIGGDFNTRQSDPIFRMIQGGIKDLPDYLVLTSKLIPEADRYSVIIGTDKYMADHIMVSKSLQPLLVSASIQNTKLPSDRNIHPTPSVVASDHAPVIIEIK